MKPMDKILIVADDRMFLKSLKAGLQNYMGQFEVRTVPNGDKALNILNGERISIVVSDINQPKTNGLDILSYLEKNRPQVPCILMAAPESSAIDIGAERKNVFRILTKPFDTEDLFAAIMEGLERLDEGLFWREYHRRQNRF